MLKAKINGIRVFFSEVIMEMKKATWPTREELIRSTVVVIMSLVLLSIYIGVCDKVLITILRFVIPAG